MAIRVLMLILGFILVVNLVLTFVGLITGVNLYEKYGKQIMRFFIGFCLFIVILYIAFAIIGLI